MNAISLKSNHYLVAILSVAIALTLSLTIENLWERSFVSPFLAAVAITSWYGGRKPGIVAVVLAIIACNCFIFIPFDSINTRTTTSFVRNAQFILTASAICYITGQLRFTTQRLTLTNQTLKKEIQERIKVEAALKASQTELSAVFLAIPDPLFVIDAQGLILRATLVASEKLYRPLDEQINRTLDEIFEPPQAKKLLSYIQQALQTQQIVTAEYNLMLRGQETWFAAHISPISEDAVIWLARDISDRKRAEAASIIDERNRMAREIHDTLAQTFTSISLQLNNAQYYATHDSKIAWNMIEQVKKLAHSGLAEARRSVWSLHPDADEYRDLAESLQRSLTQLTLNIPLQTDFKIIGTPQPLPPDIGMNLLRIGQEAITNVLRHARAKNLAIELTFKPDTIVLQIQDNGRGFNPQAVLDRGGFGLVGMQQRCDRLGGKITVDSQSDRGTCIVIETPLVFPIP